MQDYKEQINELLLIAKPQEWKDWVFDMQTKLIVSEDMQGLSDDARSDFAAKTQALYYFFDQLLKSKNDSSKEGFSLS